MGDKKGRRKRRRIIYTRSGSDYEDRYGHGLLIEYGPICHIVKLPISMIRPFSLVNISHITLYPQLEIIWKVSKSLRKYWGKYGQISFYIISCITRDCIIVENIFWHSERYPY